MRPRCAMLPLKRFRSACTHCGNRLQASHTMNGYGYNLADKNRRKRDGKKDSRKKYKLKQIREFVGIRQRTRPRVSIASQRPAPGPATYNAVPNSFGRQFRVGKGLSSPKISFSTAARFPSNGASTHAYTVNARPRFASRRKTSKMVAKAGRKDKKVRNLHRPKSAPAIRRVKSTPIRIKKRSGKNASTSRAPGPQCYVHRDEGIGQQRVSQRKTSPAVGFGKAKRNINLRSLAATSESPENIPGPVDYNPLRSSAKLMRRRPRVDFGTSARFEY